MGVAPPRLGRATEIERIFQPCTLDLTLKSDYYTLYLRNLQISHLTATRLVTNLRFVHAMHDFLEQCQNVLYAMVCLSLFS